MIKTQTLIIGAGLTGLSAAYHLRGGYLITEATNEVGGLSGTINYKGYKIDHAIHIMYFKSDWVYEWLTKTIGIKFYKKERLSKVWMNHKFISFPIQFNLSEFSFSKRLKIFFLILISRLRIFKLDKKIFINWAMNNFGSLLTETFFKPYNQKLFGNNIEELTTEWMGDYIPSPSLKLIWKGLFNLNKNKVGRNSFFYYPKNGGIGEVAIEIKNKLNGSILYNEYLNSINIFEKIAYYRSGLKVKYDFLITTIPLDKFLEKVEKLPIEIKLQTRLLKSNPITLLHIMIKRKSIGGDLHWVYFPDISIPFYRITFSHNLSQNNCPPDCSALTLEFGGIVYDKDEMIKKCFEILIEAKLLNRVDIESEYLWEYFDDGYVFYDHNITKVRPLLLNFLQQNEIYSIGRYGNWEYSNMESAIIQGKETAERMMYAKH